MLSDVRALLALALLGALAGCGGADDAARPTGPTPIGVFRAVERPVYGAELSASLEQARSEVGTTELEALLHSGETWTVS